VANVIKKFKATGGFGTKIPLHSGGFSGNYIKPTMANKFNTGANLKYFEKVFENKDIIIYKLK
jgi:hypothetical protein